MFSSSLLRVRFRLRRFCSVESSNWVVLCCVREAACCDISGEIWPTPGSGVGGADAFATVVFETGGVGGGFFFSAAGAAGCFCAFATVPFRRLIGDGFCALASGAGVVGLLVAGGSGAGVVSGMGTGVV